MTSDTQENGILMGPTDVCTLLNIKESTLRKYALLLKDAGYQFHVNDKGQRGYFDKDVIVLKRFIEVKSNRDMTLEQAAEAVISWVEQSGISLSVMRESNLYERYDDDIKEMKETIKQQNDLLQELIKKLDQQQDYIDNRLNKRDELLMQSLRESQETKQLLLATQEERKQRKGIFKFFSKD
ncbi:DUF3967 domain-containing protein [Peribacillus loiseleuriae]|uniref:DUF3967 domain-containing protein n=1 Tax=Peribacillus loiseleuriae TaxID=1679170 RepID=UPI0037F5D5D9